MESCRRTKPDEYLESDSKSGSDKDIYGNRNHRRMFGISQYNGDSKPKPDSKCVISINDMFRSQCYIEWHGSKYLYLESTRRAEPDEYQ